MTCIIVEDEPLARDEMQYQVEKFSDLKVIGSFANPIRALEFLETHEVDLVFLDIEMPMSSGLDLARSIGEKPMVIFTTAYPQYALKSYELGAVDYLLKPIDSKRLIRAIHKARRLQRPRLVGKSETLSSDDTILIRSDRRYHKIELSRVLYIEGLKDYVIIHERDQQMITAMNLKKIHKMLPEGRFLRVSKSYIVNLDHVEAFDSINIRLAGHVVPLGAVYRPEFLERYFNGTDESKR